MWRSLGSALRAAIACTIVGCTSIYGPKPLRPYFEFSSYSYVTTILIVSDATLGETLKGCWHVLCATAQAMIISLLSLLVIGPGNFSNHVAAMAVAAGSFLVALPESVALRTKRIAFGQLVIVYVSAVIDGKQEGLTVFPVHVATSTALGALASVLAMLLPYPHLAYFEARRFYRLYIENISERLNCNLETISATDNLTAVSFFSQAKSLSKVGSKLFQRMKSNMNGIHWEMPHNPHCIDPKERLQDMEVPIRGMDIALSSCTTFPVGVVDEELRDTLLNCRGRYNQKLDQPDNLFAPLDTTTNLESKKKILNKSIFKAYKDLPTAFFLYCLQLLLEKSSSVAKKTNHVVENSLEDDDSKGIFRKIRELAMKFIPSRHSLVFALKCSLTLGLAMLFGLTYSKDSGYWSGLAVAISFDTRRQPTFWATNARMQGTAVGSIYGVLSCFIFHKYVDLRLLPLLPWVVFYTFLRRSRLYGQAGAISAVIGALPILGREHYGPPKQFAIARIAEVSIGLICFLIVEIILSPSRAATLARTQLSRTFRALQDCIGKISIIIPRENHQSSSSSQELREAQKKMKCLVSQMEAFIVEAELEPSFWFLPFHGACYRKMLESLSRIVDLLLFVAYSMEHISELSQKVGGSWVDLQDQMHENVESVKKNVCPTLKFLEEITQIKSLKDLEKELKKRNVPCDIESGEYPNADTFRTLSGDEEVDSITGSFLKHLEDIASKSDNNTDEEMVKCEMLFHYSCLGFCISNLVREIIKIENELRELLLMWENENPSGLSNMKEIYCKISILCSR